MLGEKKWLLNPADIIYRKNELTVDMLNFSHDDQHIIINGKATPQATDSIVADLKDVDVAYILNLVNFHSVDFAGKASGKAVVKSIFQTPEAYANLDVKDFVFENGPWEPFMPRQPTTTRKDKSTSTQRQRTAPSTSP